MAALAFAPSAQAASSYNVMLTKIPADVNSVSLWDYSTESDSSSWVGCFKVQSGSDKNTGYKISIKHHLIAFEYGTGKCSSGYKSSTESPTVTSSLSTTNFWFSLS